MAFNLKWEFYGNNSEKHKKFTMTDLKLQFYLDTPKVCAFDTETTGLNIMRDKPFLLVFAWKVAGVNQGRSYAIQYTQENMAQIIELMLTTDFIVGANVKYDLHMLHNGGNPFPFNRLAKTQLTDIQIARRLTMDADATKTTDKMSLKALATLLINKDAAGYEGDIKKQKRELEAQNMRIANTALKPYKWTIKKIEKELEDPLFGEAAFKDTPQVLEIYRQWQEEYGEVTYKTLYDLDPGPMEFYALQDGMYTLELFLKMYPSIDTPEIFDLENKLIEVYYAQERIGFKVDLEYAKTSMAKMRKYIIERKEFLSFLLDGRAISESQHKKLLEILIEEHEINPDLFKNQSDKLSLDAATLQRVSRTLPDSTAKQICLVVKELRTLTKKLSTDLYGKYTTVMKNGDGRLHPNTNSTGTISGRVSGDMQQMPKHGVYTYSGEELFSPRKLIVPSHEDGYNKLVFQDFDQMELRVQAHYTCLTGHPDANLLKLFIPYNCIHRISKRTYQLYNLEDRAHALDKDEHGYSMWLDPTTGKTWEPTDPHGMHVKTAFGYDETHPDWKDLRNVAKIINFAVNYGSGLNGLLTNVALESFSEETITRIYEAYKQNFRGVLSYQKAVSGQVSAKGSISNVYRRKYKFNDVQWGWKAGNYLVQGSCADLVKTALVKLYETIKTNNLKSRVLYTIHDEVIWEAHDSELHLIPQVQELLQNQGNWSVVPITCGTDITTTNWQEKASYSA